MTRESKIHSRQQTINSIAILIILTAIGSGIFVSQFDFYPAVLTEDFFSPASDGSQEPSAAPAVRPIIALPAGLVSLTPPELFNPQTLSDKINGKAELYLSAGFVSLASQRFATGADPNLWMEAFLYDMGSGQNAFAVFSAQRRQDAASLDLTLYAYRTQNALFLVHGTYYVEIIASEAADQAFKAMISLAENFIGSTPAEIVSLQEKDLFPVEGLVDDSIALVAADAFGFDRLDQIYTAEYEIQKKPIMAFLSRRQDNRQAQELASAYRQFLENFGGQNLEADLPIGNARLLEIMETYEIIFSHGPFVAGVREAEDQKDAITLALLLYDSLKEVTDEP